jgi:biotin carboxyl carrier protein
MSWRRRGRLVGVALLAAALASGCGRATAHDLVLGRRPSTTAPLAEASATAAVPTSTTPAPATGSLVPPVTLPPVTLPPVTLAPPPPTAPPTTALPVPPPPAPASLRTVHQQPWTPFATVGGVVLHHPSARVERVAFHESSHDGARQLDPLPTAADPVTLETRHRGTGSRTAADVVADPDAEIRSPVTGRVLRAGTYVLYCDYSDDYAVIEPDAHPGWEVKVLHIDGVTVRPGDHVHAGETVLAGRPTRLPFESQVDELTAPPAWPHVHIEVVDPSIPDRPSGGRC